MTNFTKYVDWELIDGDELIEKANKVFDGVSELNLLSGEIIVARAENVLRFNHLSERTSGISGALICTNFRLSFLTADRSSYDEIVSGHGDVDRNGLVLSEHDIPVIKIDSLYMVNNGKRKRLTSGAALTSKIKVLEVHCKDFRIWSFSFKFSPFEEDKALVNVLLHFSTPNKIDRLFAFEHSAKAGNAVRRNLDYVDGAVPFTKLNHWQTELSRLHVRSGWRVTLGNEQFHISDRLPEAFVVPSSLVDSDLQTSAPHFIHNRVLSWSYSHANGSALVRLSSSLLDSKESQQQETILLDGVKSSHPEQKAPLTIQLDGECCSIKEINSAYGKLKDICMPESHKSYWGSDQQFFSLLDSSKWLQTVCRCLECARNVSRHIRNERLSVCLKEPGGSDVCSVVSSLVQMLLDPYYRSRRGFQQLVSKEWIAMGHQFLTRCGILTNASPTSVSSQSTSLTSSSSSPSILGAKPDSASLVSSASNLTMSLRPSSLLFSQQQSGVEQAQQTSEQQSPVFLLFLDCCFQLLQLFPSQFEFTSTYLTCLWDSVLDGLYDHFIFDGPCHRRRVLLTLPNMDDVRLLSMWQWQQHVPRHILCLFSNPLYTACHFTLRHPSPTQHRSSPTQHHPSPTQHHPTPTQHRSSPVPYRLRLHGGGGGVHRARPLPHEACEINLKVCLAKLQPWRQCYLRWLGPAQVVHGGSPLSYLRQCELLHSVLELEGKMRHLQVNGHQGGGDGDGDDDGEEDKVEKPGYGDIVRSMKQCDSAITSTYPYSCATSEVRKALRSHMPLVAGSTINLTYIPYEGSTSLD